MPHQTEHGTPNRLIHEKSPYLLQHAHNPVDWYPWGEDAFAKAKREDKPVFLSVGYSTCYWCHVMEQESFENPDVAQVMNETVVAIKVDREERPDIDALYMSAVQAMSGHGGWPMTVFLTPEGKPFWGGTYFPAEDRGGRPGLKTILRQISDGWTHRRAEILSTSETLTQSMQSSAQRQMSQTALTIEAVETAVAQLSRQYDDTYGGFGDAPKFPRSHALSLLLRGWTRSHDPQVLAMVEHTLDAMARGGMYDQVGGGFHRYATDARWFAPHFEKMLYDQALLARTYLEAHQATGKMLYADVARDIFTYVLRDLRDPQGAFYSAEDAGEVGQEGEFYVWTAAEIRQILGSTDALQVGRYYGVTPEGNWEQQHNILHRERSLEALAQHDSIPVRTLRRQLDTARAALLNARNQRQRPHRDDKILTDWNGLMIGALAYGARVLDEPRYAQAASAAADFVLTRLQRDGHLLHRYRDGEAAIPALLDDYAFFAWGLLELYEATFDARWLNEATRLTTVMTQDFWDKAHGGFFLSGARNEALIAPTKELYDGAIPSGNSVATLVLVRLGQLTMQQNFQRLAEQLFRVFAVEASRGASAYPVFLSALDQWLGPAQEIVIAGDPASADTQQMLRAVNSQFLPRAVLALHPTDASAARIEALIPFIKAQYAFDGRATAYVCENYICNLPTTDLTQLRQLLSTDGI